MSRTQRASPLPRFLDVAADAGALKLMGLTPAECTRSRVEAALQRQLDRVASHAEGDTPEADEVRLALHAAAAQLLDPETRRRAVEEQAARDAADRAAHARTEGAPVEVASEEPWRAPAVQESEGRAPAGEVVRYAADVDPNAGVKKMLLIGGVAGFLLIGGVITLILLTPAHVASKTAGAGGTGNGGGGGATSGVLPAPATNDGATAGSATPSGGPGSAADGAEASTRAEAAAKSVKAEPAKAEYVDVGVVIRDLRLAAAKAKSDPSAGIAELRRPLGQLAAWWPRYDVGGRRAADDAVLEFLYIVSEKPEAGAAIAEIGKRAALPAPEAGQMPAEGVWPAAWATGVLTRLSAERGLPRSLAAGVAQALNDALGAGRSAGSLTFEGGAQASLRRMPLRLVAPWSAAQAEAAGGAARTGGEGMKRWADAVAAVVPEAGEQERVLVDGLEQILLGATEPDSDQATYEAVEVIATRIKWRADGAARERLLEWFNDSRVSSADLRVLTGVIAGKSGAENVDATMQLSVTATPDDRAKLRAQYATAWGLLKSEQREKAFEQWKQFARGGYFAAPGTDELAEVARVVVAVQINHAARKLWLQDATASTRILADIERIPETIRDIGATAGHPALLPTPAAPPPPAPGGGRGPGSGKFAQPPVNIPPPGDGPWAEQYLRAERNIPVRMQRLTEAESLPTPLSKLDASVLVEVACFGSPGQVRLAAQRVVARYADDPAIVQAMLDQLPTAPKVQSVSETIAKVAKSALPKVGDPDWELAARRALVERLLGMLAGQGPQAGIDQASSIVSEAYVSMAGADSGPPEENSAERCQRGAGQLYKLWRLEAERLPAPEQGPGTLDQLDRRRRSRQQIASGSIQAFAGEEVSVAEMLAYIVCAERPAQAARVMQVIGDMAKQRREATHVFAQMIVTERAITRLWLLRFGEVGQ